MAKVDGIDKVQGTADVATICNQLGMTNQMGSDKYMKPIGPKTSTHEVQKGWTK